MPTKKKATTEEISVLEVKRGQIEFCILGMTPLICNRVSEKASRELLLPRGRKTAAERHSTLKHNPPEEYRSSPYKASEDDAPTRILLKSEMFKAAMSDAAIDIPDVKKAVIGRLTWVKGDHLNGDYVHVYGVPELVMGIVRSADMNKTPDVRTRAILPQWACRISINYTMPLLREKTVSNLLAAAGIIRGIGDWRQQKGSGSYGQFKLVSPSDRTFKRVVKAGGREAQDAALRDPKCYDADTAELLTWFHTELVDRGFDESGRAIGKVLETSDKDNGESAQV